MNEIEKLSDPIDTIELKIQRATGFPNIVSLIRLVKQYSDMIPDSTSFLDAHTANELAAKFLKAQQVSSDLHAVAVQYEARCERQRKKAWAIAFFAAAKECKTQKEKEAFVELDENYQAFCEEEEVSSMFKRMIENQRDALKQAHYFLRNIADKEPIQSGHAGTVIGSDDRSSKRTNW